MDLRLNIISSADFCGGFGKVLYSMTRYIAFGTHYNLQNPAVRRNDRYEDFLELAA